MITLSVGNSVSPKVFLRLDSQSLELAPPVSSVMESPKVFTRNVFKNVSTFMKNLENIGQNMPFLCLLVFFSKWLFTFVTYFLLVFKCFFGAYPKLL